MPDADSQLFRDLAAVRQKLASSPLVPSVEQALVPLRRAVDRLRESAPLSESEKARLRHEVAVIGRLINGLGYWLESRGALTPTYDRYAEVHPGLGALGGGFVFEG